MPRSGNNDAIRGHAWNVISKFSHSERFDVLRLILSEMTISSCQLHQAIYYAPFIMKVILRLANFSGPLRSEVKRYKPEGDKIRDLRHRDHHLQRQQHPPPPTAAAEADDEDVPDDEPAAPAPAPPVDPEMFRAFESCLTDNVEQGFNALHQRVDAQVSWIASMERQMGEMGTQFSTFTTRLRAIEEMETRVFRRLEEYIFPLIHNRPVPTRPLQPSSTSAPTAPATSPARAPGSSLAPSIIRSPGASHLPAQRVSSPSSSRPPSPPA